MPNDFLIAFLLQLGWRPLKFFKSSPVVGHLLFNSIRPIRWLWFLIYLKSFFHSLGNSQTIFLFRSQYLLLIFPMIEILFLIVEGTHQLKAGSSWILFAIAYSAKGTGYESFMSFRSIQSELPSFHITSNCHPLVVFFFLKLPDLVV